jgi:hypothetical protein
MCELCDEYHGMENSDNVAKGLLLICIKTSPVHLVWIELHLSRTRTMSSMTRVGTWRDLTWAYPTWLDLMWSNLKQPYLRWCHTYSTLPDPIAQPHITQLHLIHSDPNLADPQHLTSPYLLKAKSPNDPNPLDPTPFDSTPSDPTQFDLTPSDRLYLSWPHLT